MKKVILVSLLVLTSLQSCKNTRNYSVKQVEGRQISISDSIPANENITSFIEPYKQRIDEEMNAVLAFAPKSLSKSDGELNTAIGNMMADAVMELANPVFEQRTGKSIDLVLLNHGGIRAPLNAGNVTIRSAYSIMPFENEVVVAEFSAEDVKELVRFLIDSGTAHPVSGIELVLNKQNAIEKMRIQGKPLKEGNLYYVATNNYLLGGGDNMNFFKNSKNVYYLDYKVRNLLIDYFKAKDTVAPLEDQRFIRLQ